MKNNQNKSNMLYKVAEAWTPDDEIKRLYTGVNIAKISEIMGKITKHIDKQKHYYFIKDYDDNLGIVLSSGSLFITDRNDTISIMYYFWERDSNLFLKLTTDCTGKLNNFTESLIKYQEQIIKDIKKLNGRGK